MNERDTSILDNEALAALTVDYKMVTYRNNVHDRRTRQ